jgi:hypothetical protein
MVRMARSSSLADVVGKERRMSSRSSAMEKTVVAAFMVGRG